MSYAPQCSPTNNTYWKGCNLPLPGLISTQLYAKGEISFPACYREQWVCPACLIMKKKGKE